MSTDKDLEELNEEDIDEDELLAMLSPEELRELQSEMDIIIAPDDRVPVGQRQKDQTEKPPTGSFDHRSLVDYLYWEKESKRMLDEERVPATLLPSENTLREAADKKEEEKADEDVEYVYEEVVIEEEAVIEEAVNGIEEETVTEEIIEEIVEEVKGEEQVPSGSDTQESPLPLSTDKQNDLDASKHNEDSQPSKPSTIESPPLKEVEEKESESIVEQKQSTTDIQEAVDSTSVKEPETQPLPDEPIVDEPWIKPPEKEPKKINKLKLPNLALGGIKLTSRPSGNETNLESTLDKMRNNNPSVTEVNLNNIENIPKVMLLEYVNALKKNRFVKTFSIANTGVDENIAFNLANMLRENRSIVTLNIESNFVTGKGIVAIIRCLQFNETLTELRFHNQRHMLGHHAEMEISRLLKANNTLLKMGYHFEQPGPRMVVTNLLTRNLDRQRQLRKEDQKQLQVKEQREALQMYENSLNLPPGLLEMLGYIPSLEILRSHGLIPPSVGQSSGPSANGQTDAQPTRNQPRQNHNTDSIPKPPSASEPANPIKDVHLRRTPKKRDPFLDLDPREEMRADRASFHLRKTTRARATESEVMADERANLKDVIKTLKPVPRRREPAMIQMTPRDLLLSEIKHSNVAYLKAVPLPKELESGETSLLDL
ncbi:leiomodin-3 [Gadus morhua]|uniref:Leiomodin 3 n=1 Tax=Gadus morhua TaxID=8049 RepID=A0A8C5A5N7_GADMO|nr:leiomodin-3 [Gadus morhua]